MERKTAPERQDYFSHFSGGGQTRRGKQRERREEVECDRVTGRKRTAVDKTARVKEEKGGEDRKWYTVTRYAQMTKLTAARRRCVQESVCVFEHLVL